MRLCAALHCVPRCSGGDGLVTSWTNTLGCDGRLTQVGWTDGRRDPRVEAIGSKTAPRQTGQTPRNTTKTITWEEGTP